MKLDSASADSASDEFCDLDFEKSAQGRMRQVSFTQCLPHLVYLHRRVFFSKTTQSFKAVPIDPSWEIKIILSSELQMNLKYF